MVNNISQLELNCLSQVAFLNTFFLSHQQWVYIFESFKFGLINLFDDISAKLSVFTNLIPSSILLIKRNLRINRTTEQYFL